MAPLARDRDKLARMEQAVRVLIQGLGEDIEREGLRDTPKRVAKAWLDCTRGYNEHTASTLGTALFHEEIVRRGDEGVVVVRDIDFASTSEETLLPFHGRCHVAYRPKHGVVLGLSKLARLTKQYAKRLQSQERLAAEIALALQQSLECHGVAVVLQARHLCNSAPPEERTVGVVSGVFADPCSAPLEELLTLLRLEDLPPSAIRTLDGCLAGLTHGSAPARGCCDHHGPAANGHGGPSDPGVTAPGTPDPSEKDTDGDSDDMSLTVCEHHMLPFYGSIMVSYFPYGRRTTPHGSQSPPPPAAEAEAAAAEAFPGPLPAGAVERVVAAYASRLQVQERITHQVADEVAALLAAAAAGAAASPSYGAAAAAPSGAPCEQAVEVGGGGGGVMVVCDAAHMCMVARGVENHSGSTTTFAVRGIFAERPELRRAALARFRGH
ncbi:hypothetical protein GPECTOR_262g668 [Gonium pectorale]|uniref:GTP cyclohydrolase 1 n=1 Tax=Gonium pectorale TaxID=33097 RepID=A0A150FXU6_GONPE|nr:hypothetical protein GPECTOR_262g668 [Gonium pectorale]|eukprot:KXZ41850.1 hypothetical protein GPECTOR_262g668 [Gonium pectorale]